MYGVPYTAVGVPYVTVPPPELEKKHIANGSSKNLLLAKRKYQPSTTDITVQAILSSRRAQTKSNNKRISRVSRNLQ